MVKNANQSPHQSKAKQIQTRFEATLAKEEEEEEEGISFSFFLFPFF